MEIAQWTQVILLVPGFEITTSSSDLNQKRGWGREVFSFLSVGLLGSMKKCFVYTYIFSITLFLKFSHTNSHVAVGCLWTRIVDLAHEKRHFLPEAGEYTNLF
ncbi:hypothetical protein KIL84_001503 [Mauremys mutica]|uniref:Uncharacterized protein n=1 Tax=Mauremys mutica TaxID=74926 RepID=A0A9D4ATS2_9SAUR|nr:hypothetical protein KIL84_001503 [Mauremys mutica]